MTDLDPRWDWIEVTTYGDSGPRWVKGYCRHLELEPVDSVDGERVAVLCRTCDAQLPAETVVPS